MRRLPMIGCQLARRIAERLWRKFTFSHALGSQTQAHEQAGLEQGTPYLLRPDTCVGLATQEATVAALERYFAALAG